MGREGLTALGGFGQAGFSVGPGELVTSSAPKITFSWASCGDLVSPSGS